MDETTARDPPARFRFTLRTLFGIMTMVAAAIALFLRYPDCVGLFFAAQVE
jgi:hypothetical protein